MLFVTAIFLLCMFFLSPKQIFAQWTCGQIGGSCVPNGFCHANCATCGGGSCSGGNFCCDGATPIPTPAGSVPGCDAHGGFCTDAPNGDGAGRACPQPPYTVWYNQSSQSIYNCNDSQWPYYGACCTTSGSVAICGNGICESNATSTCYPSAESCYPGGETCANCTQDCGSCGGGGSTAKGWFDAASYTTVGGWDCDSNNYGTPLTTAFYLDGTYATGHFLANVQAGGQRNDVASSCGTNPYHGFNFNPQTTFGTGSTLLDGNTHTIYMYAIGINADGTNSGNNPQIGNPLTVTNHPSKGNFDGASYTNIYGWACDDDDDSQPLTVSFYLDGTNQTGKHLGDTTANVSRSDITSLCGNNPNHGFSINPGVQFPGSPLFDGNTHTIYAYASNWPAGNPTQLQNGTNGGDIPITPDYAISGQVFVDYNVAQKPDYTSPQYVPNAGSIVITDNSTHTQVGPTISVDGSGAYTSGEIVPKGTYTVTFTPDTGFANIYTLTTPTTFTVTVGDTSSGAVTCNYDGSLTGSCTTNTQGFNGSIQNLDFGLTPYYTISGIIYNDLNLSNYFTEFDQNNNRVDEPITTGTVTATGPKNATVSVDNNGSYKFTGSSNGLIRGTYTLSYNPAGTTQRYVYPPNYQTQIVVGKPGISSIAACNAAYNGNVNHNYDTTQIDASPGCHRDNDNITRCDSVCDANGNITSASFSDGRDLNFGINDTEASYQTVCLDMRVTGLTDHLPATGTCGGVSNTFASLTDGTACPDSPGIAFCQNGTCDFGNGQASMYDWQVGSPSYPEVFQPVNACVIRTSVPFLNDTISQNGITTTDLTSICPQLSNCTLPANLPNGIYTANGDVTLYGNVTFNGLSSYVFPTNSRVAFIINGNLTIMGNIIVPVGAVAAFSAADNIYIDKSVGVSSSSISCDPQTQIGCNVEGLYSAGQSIIIQSARTSPTEACNFDGTSQDLRINLAGSFVSGADCASDILTNQRDLCKDDTICPVQTITDRGDILLNAYTFNFLLHKNSSWKEITP